MIERGRVGGGLQAKDRVSVGGGDGDGIGSDSRGEPVEGGLEGIGMAVLAVDAEFHVEGCSRGEAEAVGIDRGHRRRAGGAQGEAVAVVGAALVGQELNRHDGDLGVLAGARPFEARVAGTFEIVVPGELLALRVFDAQPGVEGGAQAGGFDLGHHDTPGGGMETESIHFPSLRKRSEDGDGQGKGSQVRIGRRRWFGQGTGSVGRCEVGGVIGGVEVELVDGAVSTGELDGGVGRVAEAEDLGH